jgi:hypothetical protein
VVLWSAEHGRTPADIGLFTALVRVTCDMAAELADAHPDTCRCKWCRRASEAYELVTDLRGFHWAANNAACILEGNIPGTVDTHGPGYIAADLRAIADQLDALDRGELAVRPPGMKEEAIRTAAG